MADSAQTPPLVDARLLGRPKVYSGARVDWPQWKYVFKAYIGALNVEMHEHLESSEQQSQNILFEALGESAQSVLAVSGPKARTSPSCTTPPCWRPFPPCRTASAWIPRNAHVPLAPFPIFRPEAVSAYSTPSLPSP